MDRKIENAEWKIERIKTYRKRNAVMILIFTIIPAIFCSMAYLFNNSLFLIIGGIDAIIFAVLNYQCSKRLQSLSQMTMVYKLSDDSFQNEWNDYVTAVDYNLNREYEKKHKRK